jgi:hypothetical protein
MRTTRFQFRIIHLLGAVVTAAVLARFPLLLLIAAVLVSPFVVLGMSLGINFGPLLAYLAFIQHVEVRQGVVFPTRLWRPVAPHAWCSVLPPSAQSASC